MPHAEPERPPRSSAGETRGRRRGRTVDGYCSDCTRTFATGPAARRAEARRTRSCSRRSSPALDGGPRRRMTGIEVDAPRATRDRRGRVRRALRPRPRPRRRPRRARGAAPPPGVAERRSRPGNVVTVEPGIYLPGLGGIRIEDLVIVTDGRRRGAHDVPEGACRPSTRLPRDGRDRSTPTSSRTACTSSSTAASGASSSSSTSSRARAARSCARSSRTSTRAPSSTGRSAPARSSRACTPR